MKHTKKAHALVFTVLMLSVAAIGMSQVGTAAAALPWERPTAPVWVRPEEVQPWSPAPDTLVPRLSIQLRFASKKSVDSGEPDYKDYEPAYSVVNGKAHYRFPLIRAFTGGKLEIYAYISEPENPLFETSGLKKSSCKALVGDSWKSMGEYESTVENALEGRFVLYVELKEDKRFAVGATAKDNAGNVVSTLDSVTYEVVTRAPVSVAEDGDEDGDEEAQEDPKKGPKGTTYDEDPPPGLPTTKKAYWYVMKPGSNVASYPSRTKDVGFMENMKMKEAAHARFLRGSDEGWVEYSARRARIYSYYQQDGTLVVSLSSDFYTPASGWP